MNLNTIYSDISSFWESIYPIILLHLIFYLVYRFIFGPVRIKAKLEAYTSGQSFESTKKLLQEFELWTRLPFILFVAALVYLALFNSATNIVSSVNVPPFQFTYSEEEFSREYRNKDDLIAIAKYGTDSSGDYYLINQLRTEFVEEYKAKHPDRYESWVGWINKSFSSRLRYLHLCECLLLLLIVVYFAQIGRRKEGRLGISLKWLLVLILAIPVLFVLRYQAEQKIEERFMAELIFVRNELKTDNTRKPVWTPAQEERVKQDWEQEHRDHSTRNDLFWVSRIVEHNAFLAAVLGPRRIESEPYTSDKDAERGGTVN